MTDEQIIRRLVRGALQAGGPEEKEVALKVLWRMSSGNRRKAFEIVTALAVEHYGVPKDELKEYHIDDALAELNGGCEMEWDTWDEPRPKVVVPKLECSRCHTRIEQDAPHKPLCDFCYRTVQYYETRARNTQPQATV